MSYVSMLKNIPEILSQPTGIAAIASLGIHGAIALIVPLMPVDSSKSQASSKKSVGVLELSQADQSRLPQTPDNPQVALQSQFPLQGQFPTQPQLNPSNLDTQSGVLPPLPPPSSTAVTLPPLSTTPQDYRLARLPQGLQIIPRKSLGFNSSGFNIANRKFNSPTPNFTNREIPPVETTKPLNVDELPKLNSAKLPDELVNSQSPNFSEPPSAAIANNNTAQPLLPPLGQTPKTANDLAAALKTSNQISLAQLNSYANLRKTVEQEYPNSQEKTVIRTTIPTDKADLEGTVLGFLVVDPEGKVLDIKFQERSVSPELQSKARQYFAINTPKADKETSRYPFSLRFQGNSTTNGARPETKPAMVIPKPLSTPTANDNQPVVLPGITTKPLPEPTTVIKPSSESTDNQDERSPSVKSGQDLLEKLREARQQKPSSNSPQQ